MNCKIPFTKDIDFEKKLYEITSISLEHEIKVEESVLKGNFIISGDFKSHEVSINKEPFSYILPFEIDLTPDIDKDTIEFMIEDFTYEVLENNILRVNIDFNVIASKKEVEEERIFKDASDLFEEEKGDFIELENLTAPKEEAKTDPIIEPPKEDTKVEIKEKEEAITLNEDTIINNFNDSSDNYATYHIHMVSDGETVETICTMYNSNMNNLADYNDLSSLNVGDKLIIPDQNE